MQGSRAIDLEGVHGTDKVNESARTHDNHSDERRTRHESRRGHVLLWCCGREAGADDTGRDTKLTAAHSLADLDVPALTVGDHNDNQPLRGGPASDVRGDDGNYPARPSALCTPTGPLGWSVASVDLKQPSMHRRSSICPLRCARDPVTSSFSGAVKKHPKHIAPPQLPLQYPNIHLRFHLDSESEPILTGPGNLVSFFVDGDKAKGPTGPGQANTARPCAGPAGSPSLPCVPPKGFRPATRRVKH
ncbi:hypothetical protein THAOC_01390, partial [Thalassiosira oceanica]